MASVDLLFEGVLPETPDVPIELARQHLMRAAIELCKKSLAWSVWSDPILLVAEQHTYDIDVPADAELHIVRDVQIDGAPDGLPGLDFREVTRRFPGWREEMATPECWVIPERGVDTVRIVPMPGPMSGDVFMHVRAAFMPVRTARTLPDWMVSELFDDICAGAKSTLLIIPGQSWSQPSLANYYEAKFREACSAERINVEMDQTTGSTRVAPRRFGR